MSGLTQVQEEPRWGLRSPSVRNGDSYCLLAHPPNHCTVPRLATFPPNKAQSLVVARDGLSPFSGTSPSLSSNTTPQVQQLQRFLLCVVSFISLKLTATGVCPLAHLLQPLQFDPDTNPERFLTAATYTSLLFHLFSHHFS